MRGKLIIIALIFYGIYRGFVFFFSPEFQAYGDKVKAPWTCKANLLLGGIYETGSNYEAAYQMYENILKRCPKTPMAEQALFYKAVCMEDLHHPFDAVAVYQSYLDTYPEGEKKMRAIRSIDRIRLSR